MQIEDMITGMAWLDWDDDDDEDEESTVCRHVWEKTGVSPTHGDIWYNCKLCKIPKEKSV